MKFSIYQQNKRFGGYPQVSVIQCRRRVSRVLLYCRSVTLPGDTIPYICGRVLANIKSKQFAAEQQFNQGSIDTTYMKTKKTNQIRCGSELTQVGGKIF